MKTPAQVRAEVRAAFELQSAAGFLSRVATDHHLGDESMLWRTFRSQCMRQAERAARAARELDEASLAARTEGGG